MDILVIMIAWLAITLLLPKMQILPPDFESIFDNHAAGKRQ